MELLVTPSKVPSTRLELLSGILRHIEFEACCGLSWHSIHALAPAKAKMRSFLDEGADGTDLAWTVHSVRFRV